VRKPYYRVERICLQCCAPFWGTAGANFCSATCRGRAWRAHKVLSESSALLEVCKEVIGRIELGSLSHSKLLTRLLRVTATELIRRGWDPVELLLSRPDEPVHPLDVVASGSPTGPAIKPLHSPSEELALVEHVLADREARKSPRAWRARRRAELLAVADARAAHDDTPPSPTNAS
jgi:hypothetical protein